MNGVRWAACLWPGLPQLWQQGRWSALALAIGFALALNVAMALTFVWPEWITGPLRSTSWAVVVLVWFGSVAVNFREAWVSRGDNPPQAHHADRFATALDEYLKGHWPEAERLLQQLLRRDPADADARLLLATLQRHTGRIEEARETLRRMERYESAAKWELEIRNERQRLDESEQHQRPATPSNPDEENNTQGTNTTDQRANNLAA